MNEQTNKVSVLLLQSALFLLEELCLADDFDVVWPAQCASQWI